MARADQEGIGAPLHPNRLLEGGPRDKGIVGRHLVGF